MTAGVVVACSLFLLLIQNGTPGFGSLRGAASSAAMPFLHAGAAVDGAVSEAWNGVFAAQELADENEALRAELAALRVEKAAAEARFAEAADNALLSESLPEFAPATKTARVLSAVPDGTKRRLWIDLGRYDGVEEGQTVLGPAGILGRVREVHSGHSIVQLLTDEDSRWGGLVNDRDEIGVLEGTGDPNAILMRLETTAAEVEPGDEVVSSGARGSMIPAGLALGTVERVDVSEAGEREARVSIPQRVEVLRHVYVLNQSQLGWEPPRE